MQHDHLLPRHAYLKNDIPVAGCAHQAGTCRFGTDPADSVLNTDCRAHEVDNLYVVDTSFFPSIGAVNPALTAMANARARRRPPARAHGRAADRSRSRRMSVDLTEGSCTSSSSAAASPASAAPGGWPTTTTCASR